MSPLSDLEQKFIEGVKTIPHPDSITGAAVRSFFERYQTPEDAREFIAGMQRDLRDCYRGLREMIGFENLVILCQIPPYCQEAICNAAEELNLVKRDLAAAFKLIKLLPHANNDQGSPYQGTCVSTDHHNEWEEKLLQTERPILP